VLAVRQADNPLCCLRTHDHAISRQTHRAAERPRQVAGITLRGANRDKALKDNRRQRTGYREMLPLC
jgi:hypothetical protein